MGHDGAGNELGKVGHISGILQETIVPRLSPVGIDHIGHLLEGEKADAQRQYNVPQRDLGCEQAVHIADEKVEIFKVEQNPKIHQQRRRQLHPAGRLSLRLPHKAGNAVIEDNGDNNNQKIAGIEVAVKPQGHTQQKPEGEGIPPEMVQPKVPGQAQRQKQQDEDVGIKEHGAVPFSVFCLEIREGRRLTAALWFSSLRSRALPRESGPRGSRRADNPGRQSGRNRRESACRSARSPSDRSDGPPCP